MKLYVNAKGEWVGTQADAKRIGAELVEVPTDKPSLIEFLNNREVSKPPAAPEPAPTVRTPQLRPHPWQTIRECAQKATIADLTVALAIYMDRVQDIADKMKEK
jgi:hypothetical protein